jgi:hypothetical protein
MLPSHKSVAVGFLGSILLRTSARTPRKRSSAPLPALAWTQTSDVVCFAALFNGTFLAPRPGLRWHEAQQPLEPQNPGRKQPQAARRRKAHARVGSTRPDLARRRPQLPSARSARRWFSNTGLSGTCRLRSGAMPRFRAPPRGPKPALRERLPCLAYHHDKHADVVEQDGIRRCKGTMRADPSSVRASVAEPAHRAGDTASRTSRFRHRNSLPCHAPAWPNAV